MTALHNRRFINTSNVKSRGAIDVNGFHGILYLAPSDLSGVMDTCSHATPGCIATCLNTAGNGKFYHTQKSRVEKTKALHSQRDYFKRVLRMQIEQFVLEASFLGLEPYLRLNGTSDLWIWNDVYDAFPQIGFNEYTKNPIRWLRWFCEYRKGIRTNLWVTFSRSETNWNDCVEVLNAGGNVAVVFAGKDFPETYCGYEVVNGDLHDIRSLDKRAEPGCKGYIVALSAKGSAKKDKSGFVVRDYR